MTRIAAPAAPPPQPPDDDPFRYGWRFVNHQRPDGTVENIQVPLTLEDVLHPQEGDTIPEISRHNQERDYLSGRFRIKLTGKPGVEIFSDLIINWGVEGLRNHSPDVSVFFDVMYPQPVDKGTFYLARCGGRPVLAIEIVSPDTRVNDVVRKLAEYHQAGVLQYVIIDWEHERSPRRLLGYRYAPDGYEEMSLDAQGRLFLEPIGVYLGLKDEWAVCYDAVTGEELGNFVAVAQDRDAQALARQEAEQQARREAEARQAAEQEARREAEARQAAEQEKRAEAVARQAAEQQARREADARQEAEQRLRELEAELRRLRGEG